MEKRISWQSLITEQKFWDIIQLSLLNAEISYENQIENLYNIFEHESDEVLIGFLYYCWELDRKAYTAHIWAAAELVMPHGCSDSYVHIFTNWLVSRGQKVYYNALENPDTLIYDLEKYGYKPTFDVNNALNSVVREFYENTYKRDLYEIIEERHIEDFMNPYERDANIDLFWQDDLSILQSTCPLLFEQYYEKYSHLDLTNLPKILRG
jgi:hypothetical protein